MTRVRAGVAAAAVTVLTTEVLAALGPAVDERDVRLAIRAGLDTLVAGGWHITALPPQPAQQPRAWPDDADPCCELSFLTRGRHHHPSTGQETTHG